jgi:hypothetical protein
MVTRREPSSIQWRRGGGLAAPYFVLYLYSPSYILPIKLERTQWHKGTSPLPLSLPLPLPTSHPFPSPIANLLAHTMQRQGGPICVCLQPYPSNIQHSRLKGMEYILINMYCVTECPHFSQTALQKYAVWWVLAKFKKRINNSVFVHNQTEEILTLII